MRREKEKVERENFDLGSFEFVFGDFIWRAFELNFGWGGKWVEGGRRE